ncbi:hypothetical protein CPHO_01380 [Corynebacterium phocae]|uniref:DUF2505 domain-containing protein n=1 Tax=Corynebacterium phocae TaxID=161895 RepID=A0A1L7D0W4_9CORY|nr:DUF2505 domain-containing protein [Corynebacterium phocae]APT91789.1 hypothetical protein CPHO_01380 [Corynebacterium phocae]KAA8728458.1 DUF2505 domain-containing protein [Corynebacterium phocae]
MSTRSENTVTINQPAAKVHEAFNSQAYWEHIVANLSPEPGEVNEFETGKAVLFEVMPTSLLPEAVRAMVSQALKVKRVVTISELAGDSFTANSEADVKGTPVDFKADIAYQGTGESTTATYVSEVSVNIPLMGAAIEPKVAEALGEIYENEAKLTEEWIAANL